MERGQPAHIYFRPETGGGNRVEKGRSRGGGSGGSGGGGVTVFLGRSWGAEMG
jgi:hypothetical protein